MTTRVAVLFGGRSVEHEVSVVSARGVTRAMAETALECLPIGLPYEGGWLDPEASRRILEGGATRVEREGDAATVVLDPGGGGLQVLASGRAPEPLPVDVVFPLVHGWGGEDGRLQGALDLAGLACVGAGVLGSAVGMDKVAAKQVFASAGLPVLPWRLVTRAERREATPALLRSLVDEIGLPLFVKPANGGSSVGVSKVADATALAPALDLALSLDRRAIVERGVDAREIECAVLGNDRPEASGLGEIVPSGEFYDYAAKYLDGASELRIPAPLDGRAAESIRAMSLRAFEALDLAGFARIDFLVERATGQAWLNEVNTLPGFTPISMFPKLWEAAGLAYPRLVERLVELALDRAGEERARRTRREDG